MSPEVLPLRLLVIAANYPSAIQPACGAFVRSFVHALADAGAEAEVVHPISLLSRLRGPYPAGGIDATPGGRAIPVHRPLYASFSARDLGFTNTARWSQLGFERGVARALKRLRSVPAVAYGHFLYFSGRAAVRVGEQRGIPSFVAVGEGTFWTAERMGWHRARRDFRSATGLLAVSTVLKEKLIAELGLPAEKIGVFPNGVDLGRFAPRDRAQMREKHGLPPDRFVVAYVGHFLKDKGVGVLAEALEGMAGTGAVFVGTGPHVPEASNVLFRGVLPHEQIPEMLSAADVFVMPSFVEGSCNAMIEAMACGLPIIASDGRFHDDLLDESCALRVDTTRAAALREAVARLRDDPARRGRMAQAARARARAFDIHVRARRVLGWMEERIARSKEEGGGA